MSVIVADTLRSRVAGAAVTTTEGLNVGGALTATSYYGDGSTLTGIGQTVNVGTSNLYVVGIATIGLGLTLADNIRAKFGNDGDLSIYHDGSNSYIADSGTGRLLLKGSGIRLVNAAGDENYIHCDDNGPVELYFDNSKKLETHNTGVKVTGIATISSDLNVAGITTVGILTAYESITVKVGTGSTELTTALSTKASTGKAIAMAMVFG